ncbi:MAG: alpha/beta hydrolase [Hyphomonas sp.]
MNGAWARRLAAGVSACLLAGCSLPLDEQAVFHPPPVAAGRGDLSIRNEAALGAGVTHGRLSAAGLSIAVTRIRQEGLDPQAPLILVCMGNAADRIRGGAAYAANLMAYGDVLLFDYPGYGDSTGMPTAANLMAIRAALIRHAEEEADGRPILLWGHSVGGFVCAQLAELSDQVAGIVLETTAADAEEAAAAIKPWYLPFLRLRVSDSLASFDTPAALGVFPCPVLVIGAGRDNVLPVSLHRSLARRLEAAGVQTTYLEFAGAGHNDASRQPGFATEAAPFLEGVRACR